MYPSNDGFLPGPRVQIAGTPARPLSDLTFAVKDLIDIAGVPTGCGNPDWERTHAVPTSHAWGVARLLEAGASVAGKTITCEISLGILGFNAFFGTPVNPRAPGCLPGGSSSGSASAVAAGLCDVALGTDSGGSVRVPSSLCGLYGMRPTHGRLPFDGICQQAPTFDTLGWFARDAHTFSRVAEVLLGEPIVAPEHAPVLVATDAFALADPGVRAALDPAIAALRALLHSDVPDMALGAPGEMEVWGQQRALLQRAESWKTFSGWVNTHNPSFAFNVARNMATGASITPAQVALGNSVRQRVIERARTLLENGALLCIPTTPFPAPSTDSTLAQLDEYSARIGLLCSFAGMAGLPQMNLPLGSVDGKPVGLSIIAWRGADAKLAGIARALAQAGS
ncbi:MULTISPECIES: amidase [unclassified Achromobacter]|uniref:amidase n=1 Tax=unclassified Achromobacter TaxID=2626865 RepID=UPI000B51ABB0|nr:MULTISPECIES: amidase [unclassified Achromobacter]OWT73745.1 glutamyl-tRNA amidotransferase [Achromobacter sp. HZ34]OWT79339.1 glutamyl-tRNA amidotransferase [Achromobacter sp. HZ28]